MGKQRSRKEVARARAITILGMLKKEGPKTVDQICVRLIEGEAREESYASPAQTVASTVDEKGTKREEEPFTNINKAAQRQRVFRSLKELEPWGFVDEDRSKRWWYSGSRVAFRTKEEKEAMMLHSGQLLEAVSMGLVRKELQFPYVTTALDLRTKTLTGDFFQHLRSGYSEEFLPLYEKWQADRGKETLMQLETTKRIMDGFNGEFEGVLEGGVLSLEDALRESPIDVAGVFVDPRVLTLAFSHLGTMQIPPVQFASKLTMAENGDIMFLQERVGRGGDIFDRLRRVMRLFDLANDAMTESKTRLAEAEETIAEWVQRLRNRLESGQPLEGLCTDCPFGWVQREE